MLMHAFHVALAAVIWFFTDDQIARWTALVVWVGAARYNGGAYCRVSAFAAYQRALGSAEMQAVYRLLRSDAAARGSCD